MAGAEIVRFCKNCRLQFVPDPTMVKEAESRCPRCGYRYVKEDEDE